MESKEQNSHQEVWNRVFARQEQAHQETLHSLLNAALEQAGAYRQLAAVLSGKAKDQAKALYDGQIQTIRCLKGIGLLSGGTEEVLKLWSPARESSRKLLEKCYHRSRRAMVAYMSLAAEPEFGAVYRSLADREGQHCAMIAEILGMQHTP